MSTPLRVLIVEDSEDDAMLVLRELRRAGYDLTFERVDTPEAMNAALDRQTWDIVLSDYAMPRFSMPAALAMVREKGLDLPFIIVSGAIGAEAAVAAMRAGAHDYVMKADLARLAPAIERELREAEVRHERRLMEEELQRNYDTQTVINSLLRLSLEDIPIEELLGRALNLILSIHWLTFESRGSIFLVENDPEVLVMKAQNELEQPIQAACARVPFGRCLCGRAASTQEIEFADRLDERHEITYEGMSPHGHYCVPIAHAGKALGVLNMYLREGHPRNEKEVEFLWAIANVMAGIIQRKQAGKALQESEGKFKRLVQDMNDGYCVLQGATIVFANTRSAEMFGYTQEEVIGKTIQELLPSETIKELGEVHARRQRGESVPPQYETTLIRKDRTTCSVEFGARLIEYGGKPATSVVIRDITDRKKAEEALRESEERYRALVENATDFIYLIDADNKTLSLNQSAANLFGKEPRELLGKTLFDIFPKEIAAGFSQSIKEIFQTEKVRTTESKMIAGKKEMWISTSLSPVRDYKGKAVAVMGVTRDITERKQAEERIIHLNAVLRAIRNVNQLINTEKDRDRLLKGVCESLVETRGYHNAWACLLDESARFIASAEAGLGKHFAPIIERLKRRELTACGRMALAQSDVVVIVDPLSACGDCPLSKAYAGRAAMSIRLEHAGRVYGLLSVSMATEFTADDEERSLLREVAGDVALALYTAEIEAERKRAEEALRESEEMLQRTFEAVSDGIVVTDSNGVIRAVNENALQMSGFRSKSDLVGRSSIETIAVYDRERALADMAQLVTQGAVGTEEYALIRADGSEYPAEISAGVLKDSAGNAVGFVSVIRDITERKRAEEALRESEEKLQRIFEAASDGIVVTDANGVIRAVNENTLRMSGLASKSDIVGKSAFEAIAAYDRERALAHMEQLVKEGLFATGEYTLKRADGSEFPAEISVGVLKDSAGNPAGFVNVIRDVTERKKAEEELRKSREMLSRYLESTPDAVYVNDLKGTFLYGNRAAEKMIGYTREELIGKSFLELDLLPAEYLSKAAQNLELNATGRPTGPDEFELIRKDRSRVFVEISTYPIGQGGEIEVIGIARDITERKKAEEALRESEVSYRELANSIADVFFAMDRDLRYTYWNKASEVLTGIQAEDAIGKPLYDIFPDIRGTKVEEMYTEALRKQQPQSMENVYQLGGKDFFFELNAYPTKDGLSVFAKDITERKRMEQQLQLAGRLAAVGELAAGVAHELNNPLAAVQAFAQLLNDRGDLGKPVKSDVETIYKEAQRASRIISNLLSFARRHIPEKRLISINEVIEKTLELQAYRVKVNNIDLVMELDPDLPMTMADFHQMQQVFVNIINNAEQAMTEAHGRGKLCVKTQKVGKMIRIAFTDDGPGIPEDNLKRIFDPFFTTKEVGKGTGLGLSICYGVVQEHGGHMAVRSEPGEGTTFVVEIPIVSEEQHTAQQADSISPPR